jgi:hypothetical protein
MIIKYLYTIIALMIFIMGIIVGIIIAQKYIYKK